MRKSSRPISATACLMHAFVIVKDDGREFVYVVVSENPMYLVVR